MSARDLTASRLRELVEYDPETGIFVWRVNRTGSAKAGSIVGPNSMSIDGYKTARVCGKHYQQHRLAWLYIYGKWPSGQIDHLNRIRTDNRISNLRDVSNLENNQNCLKKSNNTSGYKGVHLVRPTGRWRAQLRVDGRRIDLGTYDTPQQAGEAYIAGVKKYCTHHPY